jgi:hypothetical protein
VKIQVLKGRSATYGNISFVYNLTPCPLTGIECEHDLKQKKKPHMPTVRKLLLSHDVRLLGMVLFSCLCSSSYWNLWQTMYYSAGRVAAANTIFLGRTMNPSGVV